MAASIEVGAGREQWVQLCQPERVRMPLEFNRSMQQLRWNNGSRLSIQGTWVDTGTNPIGSTWAR